MPSDLLPPVGKAYLVGAGPGDPGMLTLRGVECLRRADVVLYDYLVNQEILRHASEHAEQICLGQHGKTRIWTQAEINGELVKRGLAGQQVGVVRRRGPEAGVARACARPSERQRRVLGEQRRAALERLRLRWLLLYRPLVR